MVWIGNQRRFAQIVEAPEMSVKFRLSPGELFIVDNTRLLRAHAVLRVGHAMAARMLCR